MKLMITLKSLLTRYCVIWAQMTGKRGELLPRAKNIMFRSSFHSPHLIQLPFTPSEAIRQTANVIEAQAQFASTGRRPSSNHSATRVLLHKSICIIRMAGWPTSVRRAPLSLLRLCLVPDERRFLLGITLTPCASLQPRLPQMCKTIAWCPCPFLFSRKIFGSACDKSCGPRGWYFP